MRSIWHHSEAPVSPEQCGTYRLASPSTVRRQLAASDAALAACWTVHQLQVGCADVQDSADVISVVRPIAVRAISTDIVQHFRTSDLELTATCCVKLQLSLYFQIQT